MTSRSVSDFRHSEKSDFYKKSTPNENISNLFYNNTDEAKENTSSKGPDDFTQERIAELYKESERLLDSILKSQQEGKTLEEVDVCNNIQSLDHLLGEWFSSPLSLSVKFEHGSKICSKIYDEGLVVDMWKFCVKNKENLPKISKTEKIIWSFLVIVTNFSSNISMLLAKSDGFLKYGKDALTSLCGPFESKSADNLQKHTIECIVTTIHNMCISCESTISYVRAAGYLTIFLKYLCSDRLKVDLEERVIFLAAAGDIMNETDGTCVVGSREEIEYIIRGIEKAIESHSGEYDGWFPFELGTVIRQLAIFDANKRMLVEHGVLRALNKLANQSEEVEQLAATKALAHLAFNEENRKSMMKEKEEEDVIQTLFNLAKSSKYSSVRESAKGVLWTLSEHLHASKKYSEEATDLFKKKTRGHVMISYSREQRPLLLKIKQILTEAGFTVWMDIEQMRENVYDRMAEAIQDASVVLISMSYSYQRSEYCRREAAYASSLKKSRVPLLVEAGYQAEGWLALMTAGDYHYDFVNKPFESKIAELKKEIGRRTYTHNELKDDFVDSQNTPEINSTIIPSHGQPVYLNGGFANSKSEETSKSKKRHKKFLKLPKEKVNEWLDKNNLPRHLFESYRAKDFVFLARMKEEAPEAFYKHVMKLSKRKDKTAPLQLASDISEALDHLKL